ncbi:CGNR zinc finger domain-containing protein [Undibacterium sp. TJN25]|uniref:CGNR zinc finger domain-containing protein n=1 Tax=Undibacterium sp. TJN25 TaxID=3413056 RepID=UPI003BF29AB2
MTDVREPAIILADDVALDFLNSIAIPGDTPIDWLGTGGGLVDWLKQSKLVPEDVLALLKRGSNQRDLDAIAGQARNLREWFRRFVLDHKGRVLDAAVINDLLPLNKILEKDQEFGQILVDGTAFGEAAGSALRWNVQRRWHSPGALLLPIARAMAQLICFEDFARVKGCEGIACTMVFLDRTPRRSRRWCSMATCGNRAKQAAHRARLGKADDGAPSAKRIYKRIS